MHKYLYNQSTMYPSLSSQLNIFVLGILLWILKYMRNLTGQKLNLRGAKFFCGNLNKRLIVMVHNLEHINGFQPFLNALHHADTFMILAVFLELDEPDSVYNLRDFNVDVVNI